IVLKKHLDVVDSVLKHCQTVHAHSEREATDFFPVVVHEPVNGRIDHARAEEFDPTRAFALAARRATCRGSAAAAKNAGDIEFHGWFGKWKITWPETGLHARPKKLSDEIFDGAGEIAKGDVCIDRQPFNLVKHEGVRGVGIVAAVHLAGNNHADRRLLLFHSANLYR